MRGDMDQADSQKSVSGRGIKYKGPDAQAGPTDWTNSKGATVFPVSLKTSLVFLQYGGERQALKEVAKGQIMQGLRDHSKDFGFFPKK